MRAHLFRPRPIMLAALFCFGAFVVSASPPATTRAAGRIDSFQGEYRFLSNFWAAQVQFEGLTYPSVEHAYQSAKTLDMNERRRIAALPTPAAAKQAGAALQQRPDWPNVKFDVMQRCVRYKFHHHPDLARQLLATGDA